jgi:hypothetical protein
MSQARWRSGVREVVSAAGAAAQDRVTLRAGLPAAELLVYAMAEANLLHGEPAGAHVSANTVQIGSEV